MRVFANTRENIENLTAVRPGILNAIRGQERQLIMRRKIDKLSVQPIFAPQTMPLHFHEHIVTPENGDHELRPIPRILRSARASRAGDGVLAIANFPKGAKRMASCECFKRLFRRDAKSPSRTGNSTRDACATR